MLDATKEQVIEALRELGIRAGDGLLVHSAVQFLGKPVGGVGMYLDALQAVIGPEGTVVVPTFNFGFASGEIYDPQATPAAGMGAFSEWLRRLPQAHRSPHPMQSIAAVGLHAVDLTERDTLSAFDPGSAFERMLELDFKLLLLGADERAVSMLHYCEQRAAVPYRYWKEFTGPVRTSAGLQTRTYRMFVRDLNLDPQLTLKPVADELERRGRWPSRQLNYGRLTTCTLRDFVDCCDRLLAQDPWALVTNRKLKAAQNVLTD